MRHSLFWLLLPAAAVAQPDRGNMLRRFEQLDRNRDGKVTREETGNATWFGRLLRRFDRNRDGAIQRDEIARVARRPRGGGTNGLEAPPEPPHAEHLNIRYDKIDVVDPKLLSLDLYVPKPQKVKRPVMIMIHGGGWRGGDKASRNIVGAKMRHFVGNGYVYASINYRLSPATPKPNGLKHPTHAMDCAKAVAWIHDHAAEYGGDPDRLHLMGHSAGGHLAAILGTNERFLKAHGKDLSILKSNVLLDPAAVDIPGYLKSADGRGMTALYKLAFGDDPANRRDASPRQHVAPGKSIPPTLIFYAGDRMGLDEFGPALAEALTGAGSPSRAVDTVSLDHGQINSHVGMVGDPMTALIMRLHAGEDASKFPATLAGAATKPAKPGGVSFRRDYQPGTRDANGKFMGGTETMRLVAHGGKLFAAVGYWTDQPGDDPRPGGQVLVKAGRDAAWRVDRDFPSSLRVNCMESLTFRTDHKGRKLPEPVTLLVADAGPVRNRGGGPLAVWVRDDATGGWEASRITPRSPRAFVRAFGLHRDRETGTDVILAGTGAGEIYAGAFDPKAPGRIRWNPTPEYKNPDFDGNAFKRVSAFCEANGEAFCSVAPRLVRRADGEKPTWREVFSWDADLTRNGAGLRGITGVPSPDGGHEVILGAWERAGKIYRIDPKDGFKAVVELDSRAFLRGRWDGNARAGGLTAYNRFVPGKHPRTGGPIHWVTVVGIKTDDRDAAWLLARDRAGEYEPVRVFDPSLDDHPQLVSTRTVEVAPWSDREIYTGGYDGAANSRRNHNTAWIFRGELPAPEMTAGKALGLRFKAIDRDGDGSVTPREFPNRQIFSAFDRDRDGGIGEAEFLKLLGRTADRGRIDPKSALTPIGKRVDWFTFRRDYAPGTRDPNGQLLGGTELMKLIAHDGKLFAGTSMLKDDFVITRYRDYPGPQILRKDTAGGPWVAEKSFGRAHMRVNCLARLTFTKGHGGRDLAEPVTLLVAGLYDIRPGEKWLTVAVRDDATGTWTEVRIAPLREQDGGFAGIRSLIVRDNEVFAGADFGGIYRGAYDPTQPGKIRWVPRDEMAGGRYGRPQGLAICGGELYAAFGYGNQRTPGKQGGLFRRDAGRPRWQRVHSWFDGRGRFEYLMRGLTAVDPAGGEPYLLGALERPPLPVVRRIEPAAGFKSTDEINYDAYFANAFGAWPNVGVFMSGAATNRFFRTADPQTGEPVHLVNTFIMHPRNPEPGFNGAYYLVRRADGTYDWGEVSDPRHLRGGASLQGVRTIERSPFPEDRGEVFYFGGYAADYAYVRNTAWIYRAEEKGR